jgi:hypothetical protein
MMHLVTLIHDTQWSYAAAYNTWDWKYLTWKSMTALDTYTPDAAILYSSTATTQIDSESIQSYVCMYVCSGVGFPMHRNLYVVYCTSPVNFKSAAIPSHRDGTARPTYKRIAEPSPSGGIGDFVVDRKCPQFCSGSLTCSKSTTWVKRLKVPPGGLVPWIFPSLKIRQPSPGLNPRHSGHEVGTLPLDHGDPVGH